MSTLNKEKNNLLVLDTGLFNDRQTLATALEGLNLPESQWRTLSPQDMNESDWDDILTQVLSADSVISL